MKSAKKVDGLATHSKMAIFALAAYFISIHAVFVASILRPSLTARFYLGLVPPSSTWQLSPFWKETLAYQLRLDPTAKGGVFFLGDSLTQSLNVGAIVANAVNYGIGNDSIEGLMERAPLYRSLPTARAIVVEIGLRDAIFDGASVAGVRYEELMAVLPRHVPLVVNAVLPVDERAFKNLPKNQATEVIIALNATIERLCLNRENCIFVDAGPKLSDKARRLSNEYHSGDGVHLNEAGYRIWMASLYSALARLVGGQSTIPPQ